MVSNTTISQRLAITFGIVLIMFAAVAGIVSYRASDVTAASEIIRDRTLPKVRAVNRMQDAMFQIRTKTRNIVILTDESAMSKEFADYNENKKLFLESISKIEEIFSRQSDLSAEEKDMLSAIRQSYEEGIPHEDKVVALGLKNQAEPAMAYMLKEARPRMKAVESNIKAYVTLLENRQIDRINTVISNAEGTRNASLTIGIFAVILVLVAATLLTNSIRGPLGSTVQAMERVAEYDLSVSMATNNESKNELSRLQVATMRMVGQLKSLLENLQKEATNLSSASSTLAGASREVKVGSERQSESTASMAAALEEMSTSISHVADLSHHASDLSSEAGNEAAKGAEVIERLVDEIGRISAAIHDATTKSEHLGVGARLKVPSDTR